MNAAAGLVEVRVPDMGNFKDVAIIDVLVKPGEKIEPEAPLVTLETEKATMDVPSTVGGVVEKIHITKGGTVSTGDLIVTVRQDGAGATGPAAAATAPAAAAAQAQDLSRAAQSPSLSTPAQAPTQASAMPRASTQAPAVSGRTDLPPINEPGFSRAHAGPSVRKFARELGVDLTLVTGGGFKGRITHDDVKGFVKKSLATPGGSPATAKAPGAGGSPASLPSVPVIDFVT